MAEPCTFGTSGRQLLGLYHAPEGPRPRDEAVLVCGPGPQEYMQSHWALRKLAAALSRTGFHVFRFDYYGTGDSAGDSVEGRMSAWRSDVAQALEELADVSGAARLSAVGFRLGATLAATSPVRLERLVLWEPVVDGHRHIEELVASHVRRFAHCLHVPPLRLDGPSPELLGLPFPRELRQDLEAVALPRGWACRTRKVDIVTAETGATGSRLQSEIAATSTDVAVMLHRTEPAGSDDGSEPFLLSSVAQRKIAEILAEGRQ